MTTRQTLQPAARLRIAQRHLHRAGRLVAHRLGTGQGVHVWDADGKKYLDLTAAFGVAAAGHANPRVVRAGQQQMARLLHAMGDVHPHALKAQLARELSRITFERWQGSPKSEGRRPKSLGSGAAGGREDDLLQLRL